VQDGLDSWKTDPLSFWASDRCSELRSEGGIPALVEAFLDPKNSKKPPKVHHRFLLFELHLVRQHLARIHDKTLKAATELMLHTNSDSCDAELDRLYNGLSLGKKLEHIVTTSGFGSLFLIADIPTTA
jgi:ribosome assembly protein YihI (activator of Der GTPase)